MKIRRYDVDYLFKTLNESKLHITPTIKNFTFICIPRYNACINLRISSIHFFFTYVYKIRNYKTYLIWCLLTFVAVLPFLHGILNLVKLKQQLKKTCNFKNFNLQTTDLIYVEWQFFGIFSLKEQTVTYVLAKPSYEQRFLNEINARNYSETYNHIFPKLIRYSKEPKFYTEEFAVDSGKQFFDKKHYCTTQKNLISMNSETLNEISFDIYYSQLLEKIGNLENEKFISAIQNLKNEIEANYLNKNKTIELALVHGDFNKEQILVKDGDIKIIDWGDGGYLNRYFDYLSIAIYNSPDHSFSHDYFLDECTTLNDYFYPMFDGSIQIRLYVLITLLEIFAISKGEFEAEEGAYPRWLTSVANNQQDLLEI